MPRKTLFVGLRDELVFEIETVVAALKSGLHPSAQKGEGLTYVGQREFEEGDTLQQIDVSRSLERSLKFDDLVTRLYEPERKITVWIVLDGTRGMAVPKKKPEMAVALLWLAVFSAFRWRDAVRILVVLDKKEGGPILSGECTSSDEVNEFLEAVLFGNTPENAEYGERASELLGGSIPPDSHLVLISDFLNDEFVTKKELEGLSADRNTRALLAILDESTGAPPPRALFQAHDVVSETNIPLDGRPGGEVERLFGLARGRQKDVASLMEQSGNIVAFIPILSENPFGELVRAIGDR